MAPANKMNKLLDKIERRLGTKMLNLPKELDKSTWPQIIEDDTLDVFSRYYPNVMKILLDPQKKKTKDGYYILDSELPDGVTIIGVRDIDWRDMTRNTMGAGYGILDYVSDNYSADDVFLAQMRADITSMYNNHLFIDFKAPNMVKISTSTTFDVSGLYQKIPMIVFIKHAKNLMTIEPTKMSIVEDLATADVANYLYQNLKYYEGLETVYASMDMKLGDLQDQANKREEIIQKLDDSYVSASNKYQPIMYTV